MNSTQIVVALVVLVEVIFVVAGFFLAPRTTKAHDEKLLDEIAELLLKNNEYQHDILAALEHTEHHLDPATGPLEVTVTETER